MLHINLVKGDWTVGYSTEANKKYDEKVKELLSEGYTFIDAEYALNGDKYEYFEKNDEVFTITHLAV